MSNRVAQLYEFDDVYILGNYAMINEPIEDDEGFYKNDYQWGTLNLHDDSITIWAPVPNTSSYTSWENAIKSFKEVILKVKPEGE